MTSIDALRRKIDRMIAYLPEMASHSKPSFQLDLSIYSPEEQEQVGPFLASIEAKAVLPDGRVDRSQLTDQELDTLYCWLDLYDALQKDNQAKAERIRRRISTSIEQLIEVFSSLDLSMLPDDYNKPGIRIEEENCIYHLSRTNHRYILINDINLSYRQRGRLPSHVIDDMWRWVLYFEQHFKRRAG